MLLRNSLTVKVISAGVVIVALTIGALGLIMIHTYSEAMNEQAVSNASNVSEIIKRSTYLEMLSGQQKNVYKIMKSIARKNPEILELRIFNKDGKITFSTNPKETGLFVDKNAEACYQCHKRNKPLVRLDLPNRSRVFTSGNTRVMGMITPIYNSKKCARCHGDPRKKKTLGVIDVDVSMASIDAKIREGTAKLGFFTVIMAILLGMGLFFFMRMQVFRPVYNTVQAMRKVSDGEMSVRLPEDRKDEIGYLNHHFNVMTERLADANVQINELIDGLEDKIVERTKELQQLQWHMVDSEKLASLGRLSAGIAHELNNPLGSILIYAGLVKDDLPDDGITRENVEKIIQETLRSRDIVKGLLEFARPKKLDIKDVNINEIVAKTMEMLSQNKDLFEKTELDVRTCKHSLIVRADAGQMQQVLTNLIINAVDACQKDCRVEVRCGRTDDDRFVFVQVRDNGSGIPEENLRKIFEPFFTTKGGKGGTGLGLAVTYSIVHRHKGRIEVESEVGKGTTFKVVLPVSRDMEERNEDA